MMQAFKKAVTKFGRAKNESINNKKAFLCDIVSLDRTIQGKMHGGIVITGGCMASFLS
jgi:hypothetical protein